jgi:hypothetical protein
MAKDERELTIEERMLRFQEAQLEFQKRQLEVQSEQAKAAQTVAEATAKRLKPKSLEIAEIPQISVFNPRGEKDFPMPTLKCDIFAPWKLSTTNHGLTREEVELFNLLEPGTYTVTLVDESTAKVDVIAARNDATGAIEQMQLRPTPSWSNEHRQLFPAMAKMLREMLGEKADAVMTMKKERAGIVAGAIEVSVSA